MEIYPVLRGVFLIIMGLLGLGSCLSPNWEANAALAGMKRWIGAPARIVGGVAAAIAIVLGVMDLIIHLG